MSTNTALPAIFLMGPTCAGKTALAVELVRHLPCEIVSVDSAMIYRGMDIGTAKPDAATLAMAPHRLIDIRDPAERYSAAEFRDDALREISCIRAAGRLPLLVGGTGLYFRALQAGLAGMPPADPAVRARLQREMEAAGLAALHARLAAIDPEAARRIHPNDPQRIQRALEVFELSGRPISDWQREHARPDQPLAALKFVLCPAARETLRERAARRFHDMLEQGFLAEVESLYRRPDLGPDLPAIRVVGYRQAWRFLAGELARTAMTEQAIIATRQLAKRQLTWLRAERDTIWLDQTGLGLKQLVATIMETLESELGHIKGSV